MINKLILVFILGTFVVDLVIVVQAIVNANMVDLSLGIIMTIFSCIMLWAITRPAMWRSDT